MLLKVGIPIRVKEDFAVETIQICESVGEVRDKVELMDKRFSIAIHLILCQIFRKRGQESVRDVGQYCSQFLLVHTFVSICGSDGSFECVAVT